FDPRHCFFHFPCYMAITKVAFHAGALAANVFGFGEIHFEKKTRPGGERQQIIRARTRQRPYARESFAHQLVVICAEAGLADLPRRVESKRCSVILAELLASAM